MMKWLAVLLLLFGAWPASAEKIGISRKNALVFDLPMSSGSSVQVYIYRALERRGGRT
jgi:uncharacterized membrane protein